MPSDLSSNASTLTDTPHYLVGPDAAGHWLAVETHGSGGGLFVSLDAALHYARSETGRREGAVDLVERLVAFAIVIPDRAAAAIPSR